MKERRLYFTIIQIGGESKMKSFMWFLATVAVITLFYGWTTNFSTEPFITISRWGGAISRSASDAGREVIPSKRENYFVPQSSGAAKEMMLETVASWEGDTSREITYHTNKAPWVLNAGGVIVGTIANDMSIEVVREDPNLLFGGGWLHVKASNNVFQVLSSQSGDFKIKVNASGVKWWVKIGVEE